MPDPLAANLAALRLDEAPRHPAHPSRGARVASCVTPSATLEPTESRFAESKNPQPNLQGNEPHRPSFRQNRNPNTARSPNPINALVIVHRRLTAHWHSP